MALGDNRSERPTTASDHPGRTSGCVPIFSKGKWRPEPELNRCTRFCKPLHNHSAIGPPLWVIIQHDPVVNLPFLSIDLRVFLVENRSRMECVSDRLIIRCVWNRCMFAGPHGDKAGISLVELVVAGGFAVACQPGGCPAVEHDRAHDDRFTDEPQPAAAKRVHRSLHLQGFLARRAY